MRDELIARHISIHTLRMEGDGLYLYEDIRIEISIHTLRMEGDLCPVLCRTRGLWISIHTLRMEGDMKNCASLHGSSVFQSTPSAWRVTS